jgi:hypothetical protein
MSTPAEDCAPMPVSRPRVQIFQIHYSPESRQALEDGYIPLDNQRNERPDWREYWPIRRYFLENPCVEGDYYGFLSPAFGRKTRLTPETVCGFVDAHAGTADVMLFSPFYDQTAFFLNQWEQGIAAHKADTFAFEASLALLAPEYRLYETVGTSRNSVFCNYFVATGAFWSEWLARCERIFQCAERGDTELGRALAGQVDYNSKLAPIKVFIIERVACALLATQRRWTVKAYNSMLLPYSGSHISALGAELAALDALKIAYLAESHEQYLQSFFRLRAQFAQSLRKP